MTWTHVIFLLVRVILRGIEGSRIVPLFGWEVIIVELRFFLLRAPISRCFVLHLYKYYFISYHFYFQSNKIVFHHFTFLSQLNTHERKVNILYPILFYLWTKWNLRAFELANAQSVIYFSIRTYFLYFTHSIFKIPHIELSNLH